MSDDPNGTPSWRETITFLALIMLATAVWLFTVAVFMRNGATP
jgi:hypothetical protein